MPVFICRKQMDALRCDMQATAAAPDALSSALLEHFGQSEFRPGQREVMFKMRLKSCAQRVTRLYLQYNVQDALARCIVPLVNR